MPNPLTEACDRVLELKKRASGGAVGARASAAAGMAWLSEVLEPHGFTFEDADKAEQKSRAEVVAHLKQLLQFKRITRTQALEMAHAGGFANGTAVAAEAIKEKAAA